VHVDHQPAVPVKDEPRLGLAANGFPAAVALLCPQGDDARALRLPYRWSRMRPERDAGVLPATPTGGAGPAARDQRETVWVGPHIPDPTPLEHFVTARWGRAYVRGPHHLPRHPDRRHVRQRRDGNDVMAQLLVLESADPDRDIIMYINSPGGSFTALTALYDTMQYVRPDIQTVCMGQAASAAAVLLAAGAPGKRMALPNSRIIIHQPATEGGYGQSSDIEIQAKEILRMRGLLEEMISKHTGQSIDKVRKDIDRDKILTAEEAKEYGLVDQVLHSRKKSALTAAAAAS
jgi:ATP-dependent Clp protease protease subunit